MIKLLNKKVKIIFKDGDKNTLIRGVITDFYFDIKFLKLETFNDKELFIQLDSIDKIEELGDF